jgi:hypothetical protein
MEPVRTISPALTASRLGYELLRQAPPVKGAEAQDSEARLASTH